MIKNLLSFKITRGTKMSANAALITMETYMYNKGKLFENQFFIY